MSGDIINLRQARKAKVRADKEQTADENRRRHGRTKGEKKAEKSAQTKADQHLDGHKRDPET